jgi:hypothetical protein
MIWNQQQIISWLDVAVVLFILIAFVLLVIDKRSSF